MEALGDFFWGAFGDDVTAAVAAFGTEVDDPVGGLDDVEIVLDDDEGATAVKELAEGCEELGDVIEVEAGGGLVEDVEDTAGLGGPGGGVGGTYLGEMGGELDALGFSAGQRGGGLAEAEIAEADFVEDGELLKQAGLANKEAERLLDGHLKDFVNVLALVLNLEDAGLVAGAVAVFTGEFNVGEELHFHCDGAVALAGVAAAAGDIEGEVAGGEREAPGIGLSGEELADEVEGFDVGDGIGTRGAADGGLIDEDNVV